MSLGLDESKARELESEKAVDASHRTLRIIWLAILAGVIAIFIVTRLVQPGSGGDSLKVLFWILLTVSVVNFGASFVIKQKLLNQAVAQQKLELVQRAYIVAFALCESIGLFGFIAHIVAGIEHYYFLFVLSGFGILMHKPQRDDLLAASGANKI
jgi:F0F1-type ATP synthase membrane subunit c/vacuolar-type H+-ATPase subunit K